LTECSNPTISQYDVSVFQEGLRKRYCYDIYTSNPGPRDPLYEILTRPDGAVNPFRGFVHPNPGIQNLHLSTRAAATLDATRYRVQDLLKYIEEQNDEIELVNLGIQVEGNQNFLQYLDPATFTSEQMQEYLFQYVSGGNVKYSVLKQYSLRLRSFFVDAFPNLVPNPCIIRIVVIIGCNRASQDGILLQLVKQLV